MQYHVFMSYSRKDAPLMRRLRADLEAASLRVWTDEGIEPGSESWKEAIEQAIISSQMVIVLMSPDSNRSKWVQREIDFAELHQVRIVPLLIRGEPRQAIPFALSGSQYLDFRRQYQENLRELLAKLYNDLNQHLVTMPSRAVRLHRRLLKIGLTLFFTVLIALGFFLYSELPMFSTSAKEATQMPQAVLVLRYDARTLVFYNHKAEAIAVDNIDFILLENGSERYRFSSNEWRVDRLLAPEACLQVWDHIYAHLPANESPANVCEERLRYWATQRTFWRSAIAGAVFEVRWNGRLVAICPTVAPSSAEMLQCVVEDGL